MASAALTYPLLRPLIGLASWTFVMEVWLYQGRLSYFLGPGAKKDNFNPDDVHMTKAQMKAKVPRHIEYPADNYDHLHEQPTVFYAVVLALSLLGVKDQLTVGGAWAYLGLRVVHSLIQGTGGPVFRRFAVFATSSFVLLGLTARLAVSVFA